MAGCIKKPEPEPEESPYKMTPERYLMLKNWDPSQNDPEINEDFLFEESKILHLAKHLDEMANANKTDAEKSDGKLRLWEPDYDEIVAEAYIVEPEMSALKLPDVVFDYDEFFLEIEDDEAPPKKEVPPPIEKPEKVDGEEEEEEEVDSEEELEDEVRFTRSRVHRFAFMEQLHAADEKDRSAMRQLREVAAEHFRRVGNEAYRSDNYPLAIRYFTRGIKNVDDSPVLYTSRALCHYKLKAYKMALTDTDRVLHHLNPNYYRAWLYRAASHKRLGMEPQFERDVFEVKTRNLKRVPYIDDFLNKLKRGQI